MLSFGSPPCPNLVLVGSSRVHLLARAHVAHLFGSHDVRTTTRCPAEPVAFQTRRSRSPCHVPPVCLPPPPSPPLDRTPTLSDGEGCTKGGHWIRSQRGALEAWIRTTSVQWDPRASHDRRLSSSAKERSTCGSWKVGGTRHVGTTCKDPTWGGLVAGTKRGVEVVPWGITAANLAKEQETRSMEAAASDPEEKVRGWEERTK